jgi:sucrose-6F-phosphate phosphohydrolase
MRRSRLLVVDLDGTLLGDPAATRRFDRALAGLRRSTLLAFVTGRTWSETQAVLTSAAVSAPDFVATYTGSVLHAGPDWTLDEQWHRALGSGWSADRVRSIAACVPTLQLQHPAAQHVCRCSYHVLAADVARAGTELAAALGRQRVPARVIPSSGGCLDVVPQHGGKGNVVRYLMRRLRLPADRVIVCGNDGNDLDMLALGVGAVAVANMAAVWRRQLSAHVYQADAAYADGIIEGLRHWGWLRPTAARPMPAACL